MAPAPASPASTASTSRSTTRTAPWRRGACTFPATDAYSSIPPLDYDVARSYDPPTYQYAITEFGGNTFITLRIEHTVASSSGAVHSKSCIIDRATVGGGVQTYQYDRVTGKPAPAGWLGDPVI